MKPLLLDTGPIVAFLDRGEADLLDIALLGQTANLDSLNSILILLAQARAS
jgi:hypothetical protein